MLGEGLGVGGFVKLRHLTGGEVAARGFLGGLEKGSERKQGMRWWRLIQDSHKGNAFHLNLAIKGRLMLPPRTKLT